MDGDREKCAVGVLRDTVEIGAKLGSDRTLVEARSNKSEVISDSCRSIFTAWCVLGVFSGESLALICKVVALLSTWCKPGGETFLEEFWSLLEVDACSSVNTEHC